MSAVDIVNAIVLLFCAVSALLILNWTYVYYHLCGHVALLKRHPLLTVLVGLPALVIFLLAVPLSIVLGQVPGAMNPFHEWELVPSLVGHIGVGGVFFLIALRLHLCWFDIGWCQALEDIKWRLYIDSADYQKNWFIRRRNDVGNPKYALSYYSVLFVLIFFGIIVPIVQSHGEYSLVSRSMLGMSLVLATIHCIVILIKLPAYNDVWFVREEVKYVCICQTICAMIWFSFAAIVAPQPPSVSYALFMLFSGLMVIILYAVITAGVLWKFELPMTFWTVHRYIQKNPLPKLSLGGVILPLFKFSRVGDRPQTESKNMDSSFNDTAHSNPPKENETGPEHKQHTTQASVSDVHALANPGVIMELAPKSSGSPLMTHMEVDEDDINKNNNNLPSTLPSSSPPIGSLLPHAAQGHARTHSHSLNLADLHRYPNSLKKTNSALDPSELPAGRSVSGPLSALALPGLGNEPSVSHSNDNHPTHRKKASNMSNLKVFGDIRPVLRSNAGLTMFCRHVTREFSAENMLFLMESEQFQVELLHNLNSTGKTFEFANSEGKKVKLLSIKFAESAPKSQIVRHDICDEYKQAVLLFEKYVVTGSEFCINISFKVRKRMLDKFSYDGGRYVIFDEDGDVVSRTKDGTKILMKKYQPQQLVTIFDEARKEIWGLIRDSFTRFAKTEEYYSLLETKKVKAEEEK